jgi:hypothetical protein
MAILRIKWRIKILLNEPWIDIFVLILYSVEIGENKNYNLLSVRVVKILRLDLKKVRNKPFYKTEAL